MPALDMVLGADFFLTHRIYVANNQQKMYFTYNGGPVFDLSRNPAVADRTRKSRNLRMRRVSVGAARRGVCGTPRLRSCTG
jgi:hypothetical protein